MLNIVSDADAMRANAGLAADYLKMLASEQRLMVLCALTEGPLSVSDLVVRIGGSQPNMSQHLAKLRAMAIVETERDGTTIRYRLADKTVRPIIEALYERFCGAGASSKG